MQETIPNARLANIGPFVGRVFQGHRPFRSPQDTVNAGTGQFGPPKTRRSTKVVPTVGWPGEI